MTWRSDPCGAAMVVAGSLMFAAAGAKAQPWEDDWYYRQPLTSLPQQLNGVLRASRPQEVRGSRIDNVRQVFAAVASCWRLTSREGSTGQQMTLRMSFKRGGDILGEPRITYYEGVTGSEASREFIDAVREAFRVCTPSIRTRLRRRRRGPTVHLPLHR